MVIARKQRRERHPAFFPAVLCSGDEKFCILLQHAHFTYQFAAQAVIVAGFP